MASASDFIKQLTALPAVGGYLLTHNNGRIISHNLPDADTYIPWLQQMINGSMYMTTSLNNEELRGVTVRQDDENAVHMFPVRQYHLLVVQVAIVTNDYLFQQISELIHETIEHG